MAKDYQLDESSMQKYAIGNAEVSLSDSILRPLKELDHSSSLNFADRFLGDDGTVKVANNMFDGRNCIISNVVYNYSTFELARVVVIARA